MNVPYSALSSRDCVPKEAAMLPIAMASSGLLGLDNTQYDL